MTFLATWNEHVDPQQHQKRYDYPFGHGLHYRVWGTGEMAGEWASSKAELTDEDIVRANEIGELL